MSGKIAGKSLPKKDSRKADHETQSLERDLLKMIRILEREKGAIDSAILALERVKRGQSAAVGAKSRKP